MFTSSRFSLDKTSQNDDSYFSLRIGSILIGFFSILTLVVGIFYLDCSEFLGVQYELSGLDFNNEAFNPRMLIFYIFALVSGLLMYGAATVS
ncbi:hypothetical protein HCN44_005982 [Aphidius gifuensis]|uniref:Uncharacterized protein n=1 Tax=Aphidius gifuensis TaxID=684658 RepID=A0A834Y6J1_APHGI|nr:hypothetical protein HCN44_005982 [Aphidius gifuensis]